MKTLLAVAGAFMAIGGILCLVGKTKENSVNYNGLRVASDKESSERFEDIMHLKVGQWRVQKLLNDLED